MLMRGLRDKECVDWGMVGGRTLGHCECEVILTPGDCLRCLRWVKDFDGRNLFGLSITRGWTNEFSKQ